MKITVAGVGYAGYFPMLKMGFVPFGCGSINSALHLEGPFLNTKESVCDQLNNQY